MRLVLLAILAICICSCVRLEEVDPFDAPIELIGIDTLQVDWRTIGPMNLASPERFVWTCGTFNHTPEGSASLDSVIAEIRSKGGAICF